MQELSCISSVVSSAIIKSEIENFFILLITSEIVLFDKLLFAIHDEGEKSFNANHSLASRNRITLDQ